MLLEEDPKLAVVDLIGSGSASDYRIMDFRKPMVRFCGQDRSESHHIQDFPVFNGKYSTTCYVDETLHALADMYEKRALNPSEYLRSLKAVFLHRPYRRMPETGWAISHLFALGQGDTADRAELASYCYEAGVDPQALHEEMLSKPQVALLAEWPYSGRSAHRGTTGAKYWTSWHSAATPCLISVTCTRPPCLHGWQPASNRRSTKTGSKSAKKY
jgi:hydroxymethylglutaryl-CoA synthase